MVLMVGTGHTNRHIYISSITFLFARNVMETKQSFGGLISFNKVASKFFLPGYWASLRHAYQLYGRGDNVDYRVGSFDGGMARHAWKLRIYYDALLKLALH